MNKADLVRLVSNVVGTQVEAKNAVTKMFEEMGKALKEGNKVVVQGFGSFHVVMRKSKPVSYTHLTLAAGLWLGAASCGKGGGASGPKERTPPLGRELLFPADLGPDTVDAVSYTHLPISGQECFDEFAAGL